MSLEQSYDYIFMDDGEGSYVASLGLLEQPPPIVGRLHSSAGDSYEFTGDYWSLEGRDYRGKKHPTTRIAYPPKPKIEPRALLLEEMKEYKV